MPTAALLMAAIFFWSLAALMENVLNSRFGTRTDIPAEMSLQAVKAESTVSRAEAWIRQAKTLAGVRHAAGLAENDSAFIGDELTPLVTTLGSLEAKRLASSPKWAGVLTARMARRGVRAGDVVAAGFSGSFPGLNISISAACDALDARLVAVSSVTASTWGANQPGFTWPEIEVRLVKAGVLRQGSAALSLGGEEDRGLGLDPEARLQAERILWESAAELGAEVLVPDTLAEGVRGRMSLYDRLAKGRRISLYVNVGGGEVSMGRSSAILRLRTRFLPARPWDISADRGVMARFVERGVPVLTLLNIRDLALRWGVKEEPRSNE